VVAIWLARVRGRFKDLEVGWFARFTVWSVSVTATRARRVAGQSRASSTQRIVKVLSHLGLQSKMRGCAAGSTHLYSPLATRQTARLGAALDLLLVATAREHSLVAVLRRQLVSHGGIELGGPHVGHHLLAGRPMGMRWMGVVRLHRVRRRREWRAHVLLWLLRLLLLRRRLLAVLQAYWGQIERRQRHVGALGRAAVGLVALRPLGRRIRVRGLHRGRRVRVRRGIGAGLLS
jgi:hypothetical protein